MSLFSRITNWFNQAPNVTVDPVNYSAQKGTRFFQYNNKTIYFNLCNEADYRDAYLNCAPLKAIVNKRAQFFVNGKIEVLNRTTGAQRKTDKAKMLRDILKKPNLLQSWTQFFAQFHSYIDIFGYCPVLKIETPGMAGEIKAIWCLPPWLFDVEFTGKWKDQVDISGVYKSFSFNYGGIKTDLDVSSVTLVLDNGISTDNDGNLFIPDSRLRGNDIQISNIRAAYISRNTLITKKGAIGILSNAGKDTNGPLAMLNGEKEAVQEDFKRYGLTGEEWQVIVTDANLQWQSMSFPTKDLMLFEEVDDDIDRLCDSMGLYNYLLGQKKGSTFNNLDEAKKSQYQDFIIPDAIARMEQLNSLFFGANDNTYLKITYDHIEVLQQAETERATALKTNSEAYKILYEAGMVTKNQWLEAVGLELAPDQDGNQYITDIKNAAPLVTRLGDMGMRALQGILTSGMSAEQKKQTLILVFGMAESDAEKMKGEDAPPPVAPITTDPNQNTIDENATS